MHSKKMEKNQKNLAFRLKSAQSNLTIEGLQDDYEKAKRMIKAKAENGSKGGKVTAQQRQNQVQEKEQNSSCENDVIEDTRVGEMVNSLTAKLKQLE